MGEYQCIVYNVLFCFLLYSIFYFRAPFIFNFVFKTFKFELSEVKFVLKLSDFNH